MKITLAGHDFDLAHGVIAAARKEVFEGWKSASDPAEKAFYSQRVDEYDALLKKFEAVLMADTSQDAEEENEE